MILYCHAGLVFVVVLGCFWRDMTAQSLCVRRRSGLFVVRVRRSPQLVEVTCARADAVMCAAIACVQSLLLTWLFAFVHLQCRNRSLENQVLPRVTCYYLCLLSVFFLEYLPLVGYMLFAYYMRWEIGIKRCGTMSLCV